MKKLFKIGTSLDGWLPITFINTKNSKKSVVAYGSEVYNPFIEIQYIMSNIHNSKYARWEINQESTVMIIEFIPSKKNRKDVCIKIHNPDNKEIASTITVSKIRFLKDLKKELLNFSKNDIAFEDFYFNKMAVKRYTIK